MRRERRGVEWRIEEHADAADLAAVTEGVWREGRRQAVGGDARPIACFLREGGRVVAGACGRTEYGRLFVSHLWVAESHRRAGLGGEALRRLEAAARERGARDALIETLSDTTAAFYARRGYGTLASVERYVGPFTRHVLLKSLADAGPVGA